jgi:hypothetical protein
MLPMRMQSCMQNGDDHAVTIGSDRDRDAGEEGRGGPAE